MMPGISASPPASTISDASLPTSPIAAMPPSLTATSARIGSCPSPSTTVAPRIRRSCIGISYGDNVFYGKRPICIDPTRCGDYHATLHASIRLIRREMDQPQSADTPLGSLQAKTSEIEATRSYSVSLHILELAYGVLRRSGLMDLARPLMHAISDAHGLSVYLSKVLGPSSLLLLDWVGVAFRTDLYVTVGRPSPVPAGASGVIMAAFGSSSERELQKSFSKVAWYQKPSFVEFLARVKEAKKCGFAVDCGAMFQGITLVSVPVLSPSWELLLILTAAGHSHDLDAEALGALSRAMQSAAARLSESARLLRLG